MAGANLALNFDDPNSPFLAVPTTVNADGKIRYHQAYPDYTEEYTYNNGSFQSTSVYVSWDQANDFVDYALGFTEWDRSNATRFNRTIPMGSPYQSNLYVDSVRMSQFGMHSGSQRVGTGSWLQADWCRYQLTFRHRKYDLLTDEQLDNPTDYPWSSYECKELGRYVERIAKFSPQERKVGQYRLNAIQPGTGSPGTQVEIPDPGFTPFYTGEVVYIWHQVPLEAVPLTAIANCAARVNDADFDKKRNRADTAWVPRWTEQTLLFKGLGQELDPYPGPNGELLVDVHYLFGWQPKGWNYFPPPDPTSTTWWKVVRRTNPETDTQPLYGTADFRALFKPEV